MFAGVEIPRVPRDCGASPCPSSESSDFGENLERHRLVSERGVRDHRATGRTRCFDFFENRRSRFVPTHAPLASAAAYQSPDGQLAARGSIFDIPVGEPKHQDRRCRNPERLQVTRAGTTEAMLTLETREPRLAGLSRQPRSCPRGIGHVAEVLDRRCVCRSIQILQSKEKPANETFRLFAFVQGRQDLNLQPPVLETGALPIELRP